MVRPALVRRLARAAVVALLVGACGDATAPTGSPSHAPTFIVAEPTSTAAPTLDVEAILRGDWRRLPFDPRAYEAVFEIDATCRAAEPAIAGLPVALVDARGRDRLLFVYATDPTSAAWECRADLDDAAAADVEVVALQASGEPIGEDEIDAVHYEALDLDGASGVVLVGRVGALADDVITQFDLDETYIYGSKGGGWYATWWPGSDVINAVAATDTHNVVIGEVVPAFPIVPAIP
ncbi:MAG TPA: hypothetical protein VFX65_03255 [Candidatus Limnocylindrales bacterium]|nr:hypothetical protein [Candidatus Limnocylindrales bacterium]